MFFLDFTIEFYADTSASKPPSQPPPPLTKHQRQHFFEKCSSDGELIRHSSHLPYPSGWFLPWNEEFQREDAVDWLLWSLFACERQHAKLDEWKEELDGYIQTIEKMLGRKLQAGRGNGVKTIRLTFDPVKVAHRPLIWYMVSPSPLCQRFYAHSSAAAARLSLLWIPVRLSDLLFSDSSISLPRNGSKCFHHDLSACFLNQRQHRRISSFHTGIDCINQRQSFP